MTSNYSVIVSAAHSLSSLYIPSRCTESFEERHAVMVKLRCLRYMPMRLKRGKMKNKTS